MITHILWKEYFIESDYEILKEFIKCVESEKIFRENQKKIICFRGTDNNAKKALLKQIRELVDINKFAYLDECKIKYDPKLVVCSKYDPSQDGFLRRMNNGLDIVRSRAFLENEKWYFPKCNIICIANSSENMNCSILNRMIFIDFNF